MILPHFFRKVLPKRKKKTDLSKIIGLLRADLLRAEILHAEALKKMARDCDRRIQDCENRIRDRIHTAVFHSEESCRKDKAMLREELTSRSAMSFATYRRR